MEKGKTEEKREEDGKEDVTEIASFLNFQSRAEMNCVCVCARACIWAFVHEPQSRHTDPGPRVPLPGDGHTLGDGQMTSNETAQVPDWTVSTILIDWDRFEPVPN